VEGLVGGVDGGVDDDEGEPDGSEGVEGGLVRDCAHHLAVRLALFSAGVLRDVDAAVADGDGIGGVDLPPRRSVTLSLSLSIALSLSLSLTHTPQRRE